MNNPLQTPKVGFDPIHIYTPQPVQPIPTFEWSPPISPDQGNVTPILMKQQQDMIRLMNRLAKRMDKLEVTQGQNPPSPDPSDDGNDFGQPRKRTPPVIRRTAQTAGLSKIKVLPPDVYNGSTTKLHDWIHQMDNYFTLQERDFQDGHPKILTTFQHCCGGTTTGWANYYNEQYNQYFNGEDYDLVTIWTTWPEMKDAMRLQFRDKYKQETAREKIYQSKQGNKKIAQYIEEFKHDSYKAHLSEDLLCKYLLGGVNRELFGVVIQ
jgi:hypothetical protein